MGNTLGNTKALNSQIVQDRHHHCVWQCGDTEQQATRQYMGLAVAFMLRIVANFRDSVAFSPVRKTALSQLTAMKWVSSLK